MLESVCLKSFKHDRSSHRMWMYLSFVKEDSSFYYLAAKRAKVIEHDGREWRAQEGALYILSKQRFYNVIVMFTRSGALEYYVNLASPTIRLNDTFEFIDYDLDLKKDGFGKVREIDWGEYASNSVRYGYPEKVKTVLVKTMKEVEEQLKEGAFPFVDEENRKLYASFLPDRELFGTKKDGF